MPSTWSFIFDRFNTDDACRNESGVGINTSSRRDGGMAVPAANAAHLVVAEKELLPAMLVQSAGPAQPKTSGAKKAKSAATPREKAKTAPKRSRK
jgi:hypothetical protein